MNCLVPVRLSLLALLCACLAGAASLSTSVAAPNGAGIPNLQGTDNLIYDLQFAKAGATGQADYGMLRAAVWSNVGLDPSWNGESFVSVRFDDRLAVNSPATGFLEVLAMAEGSITYLDSIYNEQSFYLQFGITNITSGGTVSCTKQGTYASVPALPQTCDMELPLVAGLSSIYISGTLQIYNRGMASDITMDLFHTAAVTGVGATDGVNIIHGVTVNAQSGATYAPLSEAPEPGTMLLLGPGLLLFVAACRRA